MDSDRQNIKRVPLWNEFPHTPHLEGFAMRRDLPTQALGQLYYGKPHRAQQTCAGCGLRVFQQLSQGAPWAIAARSISSSSALHRPSQRNASAGGVPSGTPRDNASYGGTVLPALPQGMLSSRFPYIYHMAASLSERVPDAASCPPRGSLPDNQMGQGAFCEHFPSPS